MAIQWDFHRIAKSFVATQHQRNNNTPSSNDSSSLIELNYWAIERRDAFIKNGWKDDEVLYLLHPPVLIPFTNGELNPSSTTSSSLIGFDGEELEEEAAEEFSIEMIEETDTNYEQTSTTAASCEYTEWTFSIIFHETWRVPTLYFTCGHSDGTPLCRQQVLDILLNHSCQRNGNENGEWNEEELWEFVSQEEHPMTGKPSYFLHPCRTAERMELMLSQNKDYGQGDDGQECCPLLSWMSMVMPVVGCKISSKVFCQMSKTMAE